MAAFNFHRRRTRRGWYAGATLAVAVFFAVFFVVGASANLSGSTFEGGDGNLVVNTPGNTDWSNVAGLNTGIDLPPGSGDNSFGQGTKEDNSAVTVVSGSIPPNKNDLTRFYEASEQAANNGDIFLYLGWERLVNIGNANLDFEINQKATAGFTGSTTGAVTLNRTAGDLLVTYDFGGSGTPTLGLNTWLTAAAGNTVSQCFSANALPCWGKHVTLNSGNSEGGVNTAAVTDPLQSPAASLGAGLFGEAAIDLTAAGIFPAGSCEAFGSAFLKSRSSSSFTAEIKDFVAPVPVSVSNCGSITIHKVTENGDSSFGYTTTGGLTPSTFNLSNGGQQAYTKVSAGSYSVSENLTATQIASGWTFKNLSCTSTGTGTSTSKSSSTVTITEGNGGVVDCTYTNHINLSPTIGTQLSATTINLGQSVTDSATLSGATANAGGTVTYHAYAGANTCSGPDLLNSQVTVTNGNVPGSASFKPGAAGNYSFQAVYSGDGNNNGATSVCSTEQLLVKANPTIGTQLSASTIDLGQSVTDSATLHDATANAGGTVTYHAYAGANTCTGTDLLNSQVTVTNGNVPGSASFTPAATGNYSFQAVYSGDTNNNGATSVCSTEQLLVKATPSITTSLSKNPVDIGEQMHDSATLHDATSNAGGTVTYHAYAGANTCTGTDLLNSQVTVTNGNVPDSAAIAFSTAGIYSFQAVYSGDANNEGATSTCSTEQLVVKTSPGITTSLSKNPVNIGESMNDSASLSNVTSNAGGTVTYHAYAGANTCTGTDLLNSQVTVTNGNVPSSASISFNTAGIYSFQAVYSGDANNNGSTSTCSSEQLIVKTNPTIGTSLSATTISAGDSVTDSATLSGATGDAGGTVTYHAYAGQNTCTGTDLLNSQKTVTSGNVPASDSLQLNAPGYYSFQAVYSGDGKNNGATSICSTEQLLVKANPTIGTTLSATSVDVGSTVHDSATLSGATNDAGGSVTYTVYTDSLCSLGARDAGTVNVTSGNVPNSNGLEFDSAGTYFWQAVYSGDPKNNGAISPCLSEQLVVNPLQPGASTAQNLIPNDSFTLTGGFNPTGKITFGLFSPTDGSCAGLPAYTQQVTVNGNGTYNTSNTLFIASAEGTWRWQSSYSGDNNNLGVTSTCGTEQFTIANH